MSKMRRPIVVLCAAAGLALAAACIHIGAPNRPWDDHLVAGIPIPVGDGRPAPAANLANLTLMVNPGSRQPIVLYGPRGRLGDDQVDLPPSEPLFLSLMVGNIGRSDTPSGVEVVVSVDDRTVRTWLIVSPIEPGEVVRRSDVELGVLAPGRHVIGVSIDSSHVVAESFEGDNVFTRTIRIPLSR
jgi:hypothetical protein